MTVTVTSPNARGIASGCVIAAGFGIGWSFWGAGSLSGAAGVVVRVVAVAVGLAVLAAAVRLLRTSTRDGDGSLFSTPAYRGVLAGEVAALVAGGAVLHATGHQPYVSVWFAAVVGAHFIAFGRLFDRTFYVLGALMLAGAAAAFAVGASSGNDPAVVATAGLSSAAALLGVATWRLFTLRGSTTH